MDHLIRIAGQLFAVTLVRYFILAGIPFLLFYILFHNRLRTSKIQQRPAKNKDFIREIIHSVVSSLVLSTECYSSSISMLLKDVAERC